MFKKHIIDVGGNYKIGYYPDNKFQKFVDEDKPLYVEWLKTNTPEEIAYIAPKPPTILQLKKRASMMISRKKHVENNIRVWEASPEYASLQIELASISGMTIPQLKAYMDSL